MKSGGFLPAMEMAKVADNQLFGAINNNPSLALHGLFPHFSRVIVTFIIFLSLQVITAATFSNTI